MRPLIKHLLIGSFLVFLLLPSIISIVPVHAAIKVTVGPNIDISNKAFAQDEPSIAINPINPSQIAAAAMDFFNCGSSPNFGPCLKVTAYFSADGGATWGSTPLPVPALINGSTGLQEHDVGVAWDTHGNVFFTHTDFFSGPGGKLVTPIGVDRSSDMGQTWTSTEINTNASGGLLNDKPLITVDNNPTSPFRDNVYVAWDTAENLGVRQFGILASRSTDHGATFSTPVSPTGLGQTPSGASPSYPTPFVGPDGTLYLAWADTLEGLIAVTSSTDGGLTFGSASTIGASPSGLVFIPADISSGIGALVYPACGADTGAGSHRGTLYCSWIDGTATAGTNIFEAHSTDHGQTWSQRIHVNDDPIGLNNSHFAPALAVDPTDGRVSISWYDTRNDPTHLSTNIFYASSTDGGLTFTPNVQITTAPTNETCCGAWGYGDYTGIAAFGGVIHPVWTDRRASVTSLDEEIFTATITIKGPGNQSQVPSPLTPGMILLTTLVASATLALLTRKRR